MQCFRSFHTAEQTIEGVESMHMMRKGQVKRLDGRDAAGQAKFGRTYSGSLPKREPRRAPPRPKAIPATQPSRILELRGRGLQSYVRDSHDIHARNCSRQAATLNKLSTNLACPAASIPSNLLTSPFLIM